MAVEKIEKAADGAVGVNEFLGVMGQALKDAMRQGVQEVNPRRDNPNYVPDSLRKPAGVARETLTHRVIFKGIIQEEQQLTGDEIHLFNEVAKAAPLHIVMTLNGTPPREVSVRVENKGSIPDLLIDFPLSTEERAYMPSLVKILRGLIAGVSVIE